MQFVSDGKNIKNILFILFVMLCLFVCFKNTDIAIMLFVSIVFACSMNPIVDKLSVKMNRGLATTIVLFTAIIVISSLVGFIFALGAHQVKELILEYPNHSQDISIITIRDKILDYIGLANIDFSSIMSTVANSASKLLNQGVTFLKGMGSGFVYLLTGLIFTFFFMKDKQSIKNTILEFFPSNIKERAEEIIDNISHKIGGYVFAQVLMVLGVFVLNSLGLLIFNIPYAVMLAAISAILDIIPVAGPFLAFVICITGVYEFGFKAVIITVAVLGITQLIENNFIRPYAYSKIMDLHPTIIFLSLILGAKYFGFIGVLFSPAMAATVYVLLKELYVRNIK